MDPKEIELKLYQIILGSLYINFRGKTYKSVPNTSEEIYKSNLIYQEIMDDLKFDDLKSWEETLTISHHRRIWTFDQERSLKGLEEALKSNRLLYYKEFFNANKAKKIKKIIEKLVKGIEKSNNNKYYLYDTTKDYYAANVQDLFLIMMSIRDSDDNRMFDYTDFSTTNSPLIDLFKVKKIKNRIDNVGIRTIAKSEPWRTMWSCNKSNHFGRPVYEWTQDQRNLVSYSRMYDGVYKSVECPVDEIINDDDALDGWFISQEEERKKKQNEKRVDAKFGKQSDGQEVFLMAKDKGDIEDIYNMNDAVSRDVIQGRNKEIQEKGSIDHQHLPDVQVGLQMQATQEMRQQLRKV